jgi:hypothetical protein
VKPTLEECAAELPSALEDWIAMHLRDHLPLPELDGLRLEYGVKLPA